MRPVLNKTDMYRRWVAGEFGNRIPCWLSLSDFYADQDWPTDKPVALRYRGTAGGSPLCIYDIRPADVPEVAADAVRRWNLDPARIVVNSSDDGPMSRTVHGEVRLCPYGPEFRYTFAAGKMREAFQLQDRTARGLQAKLMLDQYLDPASREWLEHLFATYPDHVVELTCFSGPIGTLQWNTIFWEVRSY